MAGNTVCCGIFIKKRQILDNEKRNLNDSANGAGDAAEMTGWRKLADKFKKGVGIKDGSDVKPMLTYSSARIGEQAALRVSGAHYSPFLTYTVGMSAGHISQMAFIRGVWDAIIDPFLAIFMDRTRSRLGKHRSWILAVAIPLALSYIMRWDPFGWVRDGTAEQIFMYYLLTGVLLSTTQSIFTIAYDSMLPTIAPNYFQRTQYNSMGYIFNGIGQVPAQLISSWMIGIRSTRDYDWDLYPRILTLVVVCNVILAFFVIFMVLTTKQPSSKDIPPPPRALFTFFYGLLDVFKNRAFRLFFWSYFFRLFAAVWNNGMYFLREVADRWDLRAQLQIVEGLEIAAFPVNFLITKKHGKQKTAKLTTPLLYVYYLLALVLNPNSPRAFSTVVLYLREACATVGTSGLGFTHDNIMPDVTEVDEMITGRRRESTILSFRSFINTMSTSIMTSFVGIIQEWFGVTDDTTENHMFTARAYHIHPKLDKIFGLKLLCGVLPIIFIWLCQYTLKKYKMTEKDHELIRRVINERHETGAAAVTPEEKKLLESLSGQKWEKMWVGTREDVSEKREPELTGA
ncbi:MAG: MFS transporter [Oscillospiraceae bacterium]|nr:MFS transporter [Oscillospiraceae bacterium]